MTENDITPAPADPVTKMMLLVGDDLQRWSKIGAELERRKQVFGPEHAIHAAESLLLDVEHGWI